MGERVSVEDYPGGDGWWWAVDDESPAVALAAIAERAAFHGVSITARRARRADMRDVDVGALALDAWEHLREWLAEIETWSHADGGPDLAPYASVRDDLRAALEDALRACIGDAVDMSDTCWVPAGERVCVHPDGMVERIDDASAP